MKIEEDICDFRAIKFRHFYFHTREDIFCFAEKRDLQENLKIIRRFLFLTKNCLFIFKRQKN